jgi:ribosomal protein S18 acetylase RimI-like enzyme
VHVRVLTREDESLLLSAKHGLFDQEVQADLTAEFLADPRHHLIAAVEDGEIIGFVSALHYVHPDKGTQLWINEASVAAPYRNRGIGKAMLVKTLSLARELGCREAWTLTEDDNEAAKALYAATGGTATAELMFTFELRE